MLSALNFDYALIFDPLSVFFLVVIFTVALPAYIYSFGYLKAKNSWLNNLLFVLFVVSMMLVVLVANALVFLIVWELMSLLSYFLILSEKQDPKTVQAGTLYLIMTHIGIAFLAAAIFIIYSYSNSFDLAAMHTAIQTAPIYLRNLLFIMLLIGFGTKAGIVPLHIWLPSAHPQAPSHISCLMSGVMIKTAIYGILRFIVVMLGVSSLWWGGLVVTLAIISCLVGVIYALMEHDLKTLLAYHSVENIGIILLGVGVGMIFLRLNNLPLALLAFAAGLYHLINHAVFKGLLFLCAGSVYRATGTRDMEKMGGLIKLMPWTSAFFLIGAMGISALPPLNGFISEWLTLQAFFFGAMGVASGWLKLFLCLGAGALALTSGLAAACFVKAFGITFLARPRSAKSEQAQEVGWSMKIGMGILAGLTIALGLASAIVFPWLVKIAGTVSGTESVIVAVSIPTTSLILLAGVMSAIVLAYFMSGKAKVRTSGTWDCGYYGLTPRNEYTATGFSKPFRLAFSFFLRPYRKAQKIKESNYHLKGLVYETKTSHVFTEFLYAPFVGGIFKSARFMRKIQAGSIHLYLGYIFITLIALLLLRGWF